MDFKDFSKYNLVDWLSKAVLVLLGIAIAACLVVGSYIFTDIACQHAKLEITPDRYTKIQNWTKECPEIREAVAEKLEDDGIITNQEYVDVEKAYRVKKNKSFLDYIFGERFEEMVLIEPTWKSNA